MTHLGYILAAYRRHGDRARRHDRAGSLLDLRAQKRKLERLEAEGAPPLRGVAVTEVGVRRRRRPLRRERAVAPAALAAPAARRLPGAGRALLFPARRGRSRRAFPPRCSNKPVPDFSLPPIEEGQGERPRRRGSRDRRARRECLGVVVRAVPAGASDPDAARRRTRASRSSASTTRTCRRTRSASSARSAIRSRRSAPTAGQDRHRLGRLWRAGNLHREGRHHRAQVHRAAVAKRGWRATSCRRWRRRSAPD